MGIQTLSLHLKSSWSSWRTKHVHKEMRRKQRHENNGLQQEKTEGLGKDRAADGQPEVTSAWHHERGATELPQGVKSPLRPHGAGLGRG